MGFWVTKYKPLCVLVLYTQFVSILPGGQAGAAPLVDFGEKQSSPITWTVNLGE